MNLPNKLSILRIIISVLIIIILLLPFEDLGITYNPWFVNQALIIDPKYIIAGILFIIGSLTDFLDGFIARKYNLVTDFGKMIDAIADKMLVNSVLIILAARSFIHPIIPVVIIFRDTMVNTIKMIAGNKGKVVAASGAGKLKTVCMMVGVSLTFFYNLPFELINIRVADILLIIATIMSIVSAAQYYQANKKLIFEK